MSVCFFRFVYLYINRCGYIIFCFFLKIKNGYDILYFVLNFVFIWECVVEIFGYRIYGVEGLYILRRGVYGLFIVFFCYRYLGGF